MAPSKNTEREAREARDRLRRYNARQAVHNHQVTRRRRDNVYSLIGLLIIAVLATVTQIFYFTGGPGASKPVASASPSASPSAAAGSNIGDVPPASLAANRTWTGKITLNKVALGISLNGKLAPQAVASFVQATRDGYYVGKTCHRLLVSADDGLVQCGSLNGDGKSDPSYEFGPIENAPSDGVYPAGTLAMANGGSAYTQDRQFFIVYKDSKLDTSTGGYTVFGKITSGLTTLEKDITDAGIGAAGTATGDGAPKIATTITALTIK